MIIKQVSVFLQNRAGSAHKVSKTLAEAGVNIATFSIADGADFGILRMVLSDTEKGVKALKKAGMSVFTNDVVSATCPNETGSLASLFNILSEKGVSVEYMYAFQDGNVAKAILRPKNVKLCNSIIEEIQK